MTVDFNINLRDYQMPIFKAIMSDGYRKVINLSARRSGKDYLGWHIAILQCIKKPCIVYYVLPTFSQARRAIFDAITIDSQKFIDFIPKELVSAINKQEMKIRFTNGSLLQCLGGDSFNTSLIGTNPYGIVFSEYSRMVDCYPYVRPILAANNGWVLFCTTPFGKNAFFDLYKKALTLPDWKVFVNKTSDIHHIPNEIMAIEKQQMSETLYAQEYECSFDTGVEGSYYSKHIEMLRQQNRICDVPWDPSLLTYSSWDIGVKDATSIILFQVANEGNSIRIIDCYQNNNVGLDHYAKYLADKPYRYGAHFAPHDIKVREWGSGAVTRFEKAAQLGIEFECVDQVTIADGIENVWTHFNKFWIDEYRCRGLINALENYSRIWDSEKQVYANKPFHDKFSNYADSLRYLCLSIHKTKKGLTSEEFDRIKSRYSPYYRHPYSNTGVYNQNY